MFHTNPNITNPYHAVSLKDDLWDGLLATLEQVNPEKIAVNVGVTGFMLSKFLIFEGLCRLTMTWRSPMD